jgi:hypothetical protein
LETLAALSDGKVVLSSGVNSFITTNDYERGRVKRKDVPLAEIVVRLTALLDVDYYVAEQTVVICTHAEAGGRWREWWGRNASKLAYQKEGGRFVLAD